VRATKKLLAQPDHEQRLERAHQLVDQAVLFLDLAEEALRNAAAEVGRPEDAAREGLTPVAWGRLSFVLGALGYQAGVMANEARNIDDPEGELFN
jgi:hypothetical protein